MQWKDKAFPRRVVTVLAVCPCGSPCNHHRISCQSSGMPLLGWLLDGGPLDGGDVFWLGGICGIG